MSPSSTFRRYAGLTGAAVGVVAAGAAARVLAERARSPGCAASPTNRSARCAATGGTVVADDGAGDVRRNRRARRRLAAPGPTVVFVHGYALNLELAGTSSAPRCAASTGWCSTTSARTASRVGRGRSTPRSTARRRPRRGDRPARARRPGGPGRALDGRDDGDGAGRGSIPSGSASGSSGVALIASSSGGLNAERSACRACRAGSLHAMARRRSSRRWRARRKLVERGRRAGSDIGFVLTRRLAFGGPFRRSTSTSPTKCWPPRRSTVVAEFFPGFETARQERRARRRSPTYPRPSSSAAPTTRSPRSSTSRRIARSGARRPTLLELADAGHMVIFERHDEVTAAHRASCSATEACR